MFSKQLQLKNSGEGTSSNPVQDTVYLFTIFFFLDGNKDLQD